MIRQSIIILLVYFRLVSGQLQGSNSSGGTLKSGFDKLTTNNSALIILDYQGVFAAGCSDENSDQLMASL